jgi:hypothetical protein
MIAMIAFLRAKPRLSIIKPSQNFAPVRRGCSEIDIEGFTEPNTLIGNEVFAVFWHSRLPYLRRDSVSTWIA